MEDSKKVIYFIVLPPRIYFGSQHNSLPGPIFGGQLTRGFFCFFSSMVKSSSQPCSVHHVFNV